MFTWFNATTNPVNPHYLLNHKTMNYYGTSLPSSVKGMCSRPPSLIVLSPVSSHCSASSSTLSPVVANITGSAKGMCSRPSSVAMSPVTGSPVTGSPASAPKPPAQVWSNLPNITLSPDPVSPRSEMTSHCFSPVTPDLFTLEKNQFFIDLTYISANIKLSTQVSPNYKKALEVATCYKTRLPLFHIIPMYDFELQYGIAPVLPMNPNPRCYELSDICSSFVYPRVSIEEPNRFVSDENYKQRLTFMLNVVRKGLEFGQYKDFYIFFMSLCRVMICLLYAKYRHEIHGNPAPEERQELRNLVNIFYAMCHRRWGCGFADNAPVFVIEFIKHLHEDVTQLHKVEEFLFSFIGNTRLMYYETLYMESSFTNETYRSKVNISNQQEVYALYYCPNTTVSQRREIHALHMDFPFVFRLHD